MFYVNLCPFKKDIFHCNDQLHNFTQKQHEQWKMSFLRNFCLHILWIFHLKPIFLDKVGKRECFRSFPFAKQQK